MVVVYWLVCFILVGHGGIEAVEAQGKNLFLFICNIAKLLLSFFRCFQYIVYVITFFLLLFVVFMYEWNH